MEQVRSSKVMIHGSRNFVPIFSKPAIRVFICSNQFGTQKKTADDEAIKLVSPKKTSKIRTVNLMALSHQFLFPFQPQLKLVISEPKHFILLEQGKDVQNHHLSSF